MYKFPEFHIKRKPLVLYFGGNFEIIPKNVTFHILLLYRCAIFRCWSSLNPDQPSSCQIITDSMLPNGSILAVNGAWQHVFTPTVASSFALKRIGRTPAYPKYSYILVSVIWHESRYLRLPPEQCLLCAGGVLGKGFQPGSRAQALLQADGTPGSKSFTVTPWLGRGIRGKQFLTQEKRRRDSQTYLCYFRQHSLAVVTRPLHYAVSEKPLAHCGHLTCTDQSCDFPE